MAAQGGTERRPVSYTHLDVYKRQALPALTSTVDRVPPYGGALPVPSDAIGRMRLLAIADISQGRLGRKTVFDEVFVLSLIHI